MYLKKKGIERDNISNDTIVFDFVSGGTTWYNLSKLLDVDIKGVCFATMNLPNEMYSDDNADIFSAYGNIKSYDSSLALSKYYLIMESILTEKRE